MSGSSTDHERLFWPSWAELALFQNITHLSAPQTPQLQTILHQDRLQLKSLQLFP